MAQMERITIEKKSEIENKVYHPDYLKIIGFGDAEIIEENLEEKITGGGKNSFPYRYFVFLLTGKEDTSPTIGANTYEYFKSLLFGTKEKSGEKGPGSEMVEVNNPLLGYLDSSREKESARPQISNKVGVEKPGKGPSLEKERSTPILEEVSVEESRENEPSTPRIIKDPPSLNKEEINEVGVEESGKESREKESETPPFSNEETSLNKEEIKEMSVEKPGEESREKESATPPFSKEETSLNNESTTPPIINEVGVEKSGKESRENEPSTLPILEEESVEKVNSLNKEEIKEMSVEKSGEESREKESATPPFSNEVGVEESGKESREKESATPPFSNEVGVEESGKESREKESTTPPFSNEVGVEESGKESREKESATLPIIKDETSLNKEEKKEMSVEKSGKESVEATPPPIIKGKWIINIPIKSRRYELGVYEKAEIRTRYEMKENRAMKMYNVFVEGEVREIGERVIRLGEVYRGYKKREYKEESLPGTMMSKYAAVVAGLNV
jgi:hypothetical protein